MQRISLTERPDWRVQAECDGFHFHTFEEGPYWFEQAAYRLTLHQVEHDLEAVTDELYALCLDFVERAVQDEKILTDLKIPTFAWPIIQDSWQRQESSLYGRMDLCYDGTKPAKLLEFNADTPTSVYEAAYFQWGWLEGAIQQGLIPPNSDQYNSLHEQLIAAFKQFPASEAFHLASCGGSEEDRATVEYLRDCANQAGLNTRFLYVEEIGADAGGQFNDLQDEPIRWLFKLYPWEWLWQEPYAKLLADCDTHFIEPPWKALLSNKAMLAYLWRWHPDHPNLLPAFLESDPDVASLKGSYARKPVFAREGANIGLFDQGKQVANATGLYGEEGYIRQAFCPLPKFDNYHAVIGSWIANGQACGIGIREDDGLITTDDARFVPHFIA
jgi:glutathionylspermidine synthase